ncbi:MAG: hypothetical protein VR73_03000 [Gammaproteobacteria bacterium BRH_c0]|nr:MAG: hypothetical protein VR73_03000 [Gammaproteobacteria bacterium BRH_c0]
MLFRDPRQHSVDQVINLKRLVLSANTLTTTQLIYLLSELSTQGLSEFLPLHNHLSLRTDRKDVHVFLKRCHDEWNAIVTMDRFQDMFADSKLIEMTYDLYKPIYERGKKLPEVVLVVFATMFNNFYISNLAFLALIRKIGVSVIIMKDPTVFNYLNGIPGLAKDFDESMAKLSQFIKANKYKKIVTTGFSSGGYASLLAATKLGASGCLALAAHSDFSPNSCMPQPRFMTDEVRSKISQNSLLDLKVFLSDFDGQCEWKLFYGENSLKDKLHAKNLESVRNFTVEEIKGCGHAVVSPLFTSGRLENELRAMLY